VHKIAFHIGNYPVAWFGIFVAIAFVLGLWTAARRGARDGLTADQMMDAGPWLILGTIVGARLWYVVTYWQEGFAREPWTEILMVQRGGLVFYGGLVGASAATLIYLIRKKIPIWKFGDAVAPSIALGYVFGRMGCLMNGCCYGRTCDLPWAIRFPQDHPTHGASVHPTQIYDAILSGLLYLGLAWLHRRKRFDGQVFAAYLICYAVIRSIVESFRGDYSESHIHGIFTPAQLFGVVILAVGLILFWKLPRPRKQAA
jgi:phosphatidylglycerol---prolipoprotein diacylglyceryl transferase